MKMTLTHQISIPLIPQILSVNSIQVMIKRQGQDVGDFQDPHRDSI